MNFVLQYVADLRNPPDFLELARRQKMADSERSAARLLRYMRRVGIWGPTLSDQSLSASGKSYDLGNGFYLSVIYVSEEQFLAVAPCAKPHDWVRVDRALDLLEFLGNRATTLEEYMQMMDLINQKFSRR